MSLSSQIDYAQPDLRPATVATTIVEATAEAGINLRTISGCPPAPTCAIEAVALVAAGTLKVTLAGGGQASIALPIGIPQFRRIAAVSIDVGTDVGTGGFVTAYWGSEYNKNA
jgi:3-oxoacyl-(acyl-carrier-protein) synthase